MSAVKKYEGRLVTLGDGNLYAHEDGTPDPFDADGNPALRAVVADPESDSYVFIEEGAQSHNERFHKQFTQVQMTSGLLFNEKGEQVYAGDDHHVFPQATDPHFDDAEPKFKTTTTSHDDAVAPTVTGYTGAYKGGHDVG
jgi:hypothetical protein